MSAGLLSDERVGLGSLCAGRSSSLSMTCQGRPEPSPIVFRAAEAQKVLSVGTSDGVTQNGR